MKNRTDNKLIMLMLCCSAALTACNKNTDDLDAYIKASAAKHIGSVKPIPQFKPYESFAYTASDLRDPFEPNEEIDKDEELKKNALRPDSVRPKQFLESFPLDTLSMVGILEQKEQVWALVKDPKNVVHRVQTGNYLGQNEGKILSITETDINLMEIVSDGLGGYVERAASLTIGGD